MNRQDIKKIISNEFGFSINKILLLDFNKNTRGKFDYIVFTVCGVEYQMFYSYVELRYKLVVIECHDRILRMY